VDVQQDQWPWRRVDKDVCAILVYLQGDIPGSVTVSGPDILSLAVSEETGPDKVGHSLIVVKEGQRALQSDGAIARFFRRPK
jgi:hypothetical protein